MWRDPFRAQREHCSAYMPYASEENGMGYLELAELRGSERKAASPWLLPRIESFFAKGSAKHGLDSISLKRCTGRDRQMSSIHRNVDLCCAGVVGMKRERLASSQSIRR